MMCRIYADQHAQEELDDLLKIDHGLSNLEIGAVVMLRACLEDDEHEDGAHLTSGQTRRLHKLWVKHCT